MKKLNCPKKVLYIFSYLFLIFIFSFACKTALKEPPRINAIGLGCEDNYCVWVKGDHFGENTVVEVRKALTGGSPIGKYTQFERGMNGPDQVITFAIKEQEVKDALNSPTGVIFKVINWGNNLSADSKPIVRQVNE